MSIRNLAIAIDKYTEEVAYYDIEEAREDGIDTLAATIDLLETDPATLLTWFDEEIVNYSDGEDQYSKDLLKRARAIRHEIATTMTEDKYRFICALNEALIKYGAGRYDHLADEPVWYADECDEGIPRGMQVMGYKDRMIDITVDSLTSITREFIGLIS